LTRSEVNHFITDQLSFDEHRTQLFSIFAVSFIGYKESWMSTINRFCSGLHPGLEASSPEFTLFLMLAPSSARSSE
jgi:hypothetical protein